MHVEHRPVARSQALPLELVEGKLAVPAVRAETVPRPRLIERLASSGASLTTIISPAGYGKTTLLAQWAESDPRPFAWVSVDERDDDPVVFLTYVAAALDRIEPVDDSVFVALTGPDSSIWPRAVPRLGAAIASFEQPFVLAIDDLHRLQARDTLDAVVSLVAHLPEGSQLALASRSEPDLPTARLRTRGQLHEVGPDALALDREEARNLLRKAGLKVSDAEAAELHERTEGWAAGLYLAALSLRARRRADDLASFGGSDRFVADFLWQEHLSALPPKQVRFLTRTSVLERMCAPLCDAVLGRSDSGRMLASLEQANLFLVPLDHQREWYRYHHLFHETLRAELERREPELVADLCTAAADWCEANGRPEWAIDYAAAAGDTPRVARLVASLALRFFRAGRVATAEAWFGRFDEPAVLERYPAIALLGALVHALRGRPVEAERFAEALERSKHKGPLPDGSASIRAWVAFIQCFLCRNGIERLQSDAETAVTELGEASDFRPIALMLRGISLVLAGDDPAADSVLAEAAESAAARGAVHAARVALAERALIASRQGDDSDADALVAAAENLGREQFDDYMPTALKLAASAQAALRRGDPEGARVRLAKAHALRPQLSYAIPWLAVQVCLELARAHLALADVAGARELLRQADQVLRVRPDLGILVEQAAALRQQVTAIPRRSESGWAATLTTAELRLLPLLTTHLTFREIGERLFVSRNTVKTQAISVYRKLGASSRSEAISRAAELGLVDEAAVPAPRNFTPGG